MKGKFGFGFGNHQSLSFDKGDNCNDDGGDSNDADDDDVKKKLGVVEGAFALLRREWSAGRSVEVLIWFRPLSSVSGSFDQTGSGDGSKQLLYYCPVTKLFAHDEDGDDADDDGDDGED